LTCICSRLNFLIEKRELFRGVETLIKYGDIIRLWCRINPSIFVMVGEMIAHVQGSRSKAIIADTLRFFQFPDYQRFAGVT
jgi:hypothetical protein